MKKKTNKKVLPADLYAHAPNPNLEWAMPNFEYPNEDDSLDEEQKELHHAADQFFKVVFGGGGEVNVETCMCHFGDPELNKLLNFKTLQIDDPVYIDKHLQAYFSDVAWKIDSKDAELKIVLLKEHKSYPDRFISVQVMGYLWFILQRGLNKKPKKLSLVLPIVIYHGERKWLPKELWQLYPESAAPFYKYIPKFGMIFIHVDSIPEEVLLSMPDDNVVKSMFLILKYRKSEKDLRRLFPHLFAFYDKSPHLSKYLEPFALFLTRMTKLPTESMDELIESILSPTTKNAVMTTFASYLDKGRAEGKLQGIIEGRAEGKIEGKIEGIIEGTIKVLYKFKKSVTITDLSEITNAPEADIQLWINRFTLLQTNRLNSKSVTETAHATQLTEKQVQDWWAFIATVDKNKKAI